MDQNIDFFGSDQIQTAQYPKIYPPSQEIRDEVFQAKGDLMKSIQTFLEEFNYIPFEEKPHILLQDLQIINKELKECNHPTFYDNKEDHFVQNKENLENSLNSNQEKEGPPQDSDIQLLCMHDNVDDLIESALNFKLLSINSQHLNKEKQEVRNVVEQLAERSTGIIESLQNSKVIHKSSTSLKNTSQISPVHAVTPILSTKEPEYSPSMGYKNPNTTPETKSVEIIKSGVEELVPILSKNEVTSEDKKECDVPVCENSPNWDDHSEIFSDSKNDDDISSDGDSFEDIEYVEASLPDPEIVSVEKENVVHQEEEEIDLEDIFQIQDERLINIVKNDISDDSANDPLLEEADLFLASDNSMPLDADSELDAGKEIPVVMKDEFDNDNYSSFMFVIYSKMFLSFLSAESEDTIFDPEIPSGEIKVHIKVLSVLWGNRLPIRMYAQPEDLKELFQKLLEDLQIINKELKECNRPTFSDSKEDHSVQNKENLENSSNSNQVKEGPPQDSDIRQLIREEWCIEVCEEQKQNMEDTILELVEICHQKELLCMHDNVDDLFERALNSKLLSINSQCLNMQKQEVKNVMEQPAELTPILSTKEPEYSPSMGYENPNTTPETESDEIIKSGVEELVPILSENEVTLEDKKECDVPICENSPNCDDHSEIFSDFKNDDDFSSDNDAFEDIEYVEASLPDPEIVSVEEENVVHQKEEEIDLEDIFQIQDVIRREKLLSINRLIANIESLNDNPTPDRVLNSFVSFPISKESDNSLSDNFSLEFKTFCDHTEETRSDNTTTHADNSLPEYDLFSFEIEPDQERLINVVKNDISDDSSNDPLLEEADYFLLLIIRYHRSSESDFDNPSFLRPLPEPPNADYELDVGKEIPVVMKDEFDDDNYSSFMFVIYSKMFLSFLSAESEDTTFDPGISV
nr:hypothetical protein [Tanacetum cinerariifolium]